MELIGFGARDRWLTVLCFYVAISAGGCGGKVTGVDGESSFVETGKVPDAGEANAGQSAPVAEGPGDEAVSTALPNQPDPSSDDEGWIAFDSNREDFNRDIYVSRPDGTQLRRLTDATSIDREPSFAPDGEHIAFTSDRSAVPQVFLLAVADATVTQLTDMPDGADQPSFSRDGTMVAFHSGPSVYVIELGGMDEQLVATGSDDFNAYFWPDFSADDSELVFDRNNEINAVALSGDGLRMIVQNWTVIIKSPRVSPDGAEVAYHVTCDARLSVWTTPFGVTTEPCKGQRVSPVGELDAQRPTWGPDNLIAYEQVDPATNISDIVIVSRDAGSVPVAITDGVSDNRNPSWLTRGMGRTTGGTETTTTRHAACEASLPAELPELPRVNEDATGRPLFDAWRDLSCSDVTTTQLCSEAEDGSGGCPGLCFRGQEFAEDGVCSYGDIDVGCDGEGEVIGYDDGRCWMCSPPEAHARACCEGLPGFDCRAWPFPADGKPGMVCARHEDCEPGLICGKGGTNASGYGVCQCPGVNVELPDSCDFLWGR